MANKLDITKVDLPEDWSDDIRMNFLFAPFREKTVNPEGWEAKMRFWTKLIQELCFKSKTAVLNHSALRFALERKGKYPQCLDVVLENMYNNGLLTSISNFSRLVSEKGWIRWGYDMLVQKPLSWGLSTIQRVINSNQEEEHNVVISVVKELATNLFERNKVLIGTDATNNVMFLDIFEEQCKDICTGTNFELAIIQLQKESKVYIAEDRGRKIIKFQNQGDKVEPLTELDKGILNLQRAKVKVLEDIDKLEESIQSFREETKQHLRSDCHTKAMISLKKKKRLEQILNKKSIALDNIESLLYQIQNSGSEKMVLEAYRAGAQAIKNTVKEDLNLDDIDTTMANVEDMLDDYEEVRRTLSKSIGPEGDTLQDYEDELKELLASEKENSPKKTKQSSPPRVSEEDLLKRLAALRTPPEGVPPIKKPARHRETIN